MIFTQVMNFLFNHFHSILLLLGLVLVVVAITFLSNVYYGMLALGIVFIGVSFVINPK